MQLPAPIRAYFEADQTPGGPAPIGMFAHNAVVRDEGKTHTGHEAIAAWWNAAKAKYHHTAVPCEIREEKRNFTVRATVTGQFSGSPAVLTFSFQLDDGLIAALEISA
jgi:hypothetical protein